jgi:hypothetical protein
MDKVDFFAGERHFVDHLLPVYMALPEEVRGEFIIGSKPVNPGRLTVVSAFGDYKKVDGPVIYIEHGVGFSFGNGHTSYAGSPQRDKVVLFLEVNEQTQRLNTATFPETKSVLVGSPKLDAWVARGPKPVVGKPNVAFSFHWDCRVVPETRSAFPIYKDELGRLLRFPNKLSWTPLGHGHPRLWPTLEKFWRSCRVERVKEFNDVVTVADVYVADATSTLYEFAALDRPVVVLNAPFYRRNVNHGLRFWDHVPGIQVDHPRDLQDAINDAISVDSFASERRKAVEYAYPFLGESAPRAAAAICDLF